MDKLAQAQAMMAPITDTKSLREVLDARIAANMEEIQRLALSGTPEDNYKRLQLIGQNDLMFRLLSQIK